MSKRPEELILKHYRARYSKGDWLSRGKILGEFCEHYGYHRKSATRLLNGIEKDHYGKRRGPKIRYESKDLIPILKKIWLATDQMCSRKLKAALVLWLPHLEEVSAKNKNLLLMISASTLDRVLKPLRLRYKKRFGSTRPGSLLKTQIPIKTDHWDVTKPGFMEADTVAHCGNSIAGDFIWSVNLTDILTGWTEIRATWNKGSAGVIEQIQAIEKHLPFALLGFDCDNGAEFLNYHLMHYFTERTNIVQFTRSRPYHKDDNAHVEQKNYTQSVNCLVTIVWKILN